MGELMLPQPQTVAVGFEQLSLFELADLANREHALARTSALEMVEHAINAGEALLRAKAKKGHGDWLGWLADNFDGSRQTAQAYMRVSKSQRAGLLTGDEPSLRKALEAIAVEMRSPVYDRNAAGLHEGVDLNEGDTSGDRWQLLFGDFRKRLQEVTAGTVAAIVTDPPYPEPFLPLWDDLGREAVRLLQQGGVLVARSPHLFMPEVLDRLRAHLSYGWIYVEPWTGSSVRFLGRKIAVTYQPWVAFSNGPWPSGRIEWHRDTLAESPRSKSRYVWEQAPSVAAELIATLVPAGGLVIDPFAGSGSYGEAALGVGCCWIGVEIDPAGHAQATERLREIAA
jgi:hypothetical protein